MWCRELHPQGAGHLPGLNVTLIDLSRAMLDRAVQRRKKPMAPSLPFKAISARSNWVKRSSTSFWPLRCSTTCDHFEWQIVFANCYWALRLGGSIWIFDLVDSSMPAVQKLMWQRYGEYLKNLKDASYRDEVFAYSRRRHPTVAAVPTGPVASGRLQAD